MQLIYLLAFVVGATVAQRPCAAPWQLTFRAAQWEYDGRWFARYFGEYDRQNYRTVFFVEDEHGGAREIREYLFLHYEHRGFEIDLKTKQCKTFSIGEFRPWEVPYNATYKGEASVGGPGEVCTVDQWSDEIPSRRETWLGDFSLINCYPVNQFLLEAHDFNRTVLTSYYDIVKGIANPDDFNVPEECRHDALEVAELPMAARLARAITSGTLHDY